LIDKTFRPNTSHADSLKIDCFQFQVPAAKTGTVLYTL